MCSQGDAIPANPSPNINDDAAVVHASVFAHVVDDLGQRTLLQGAVEPLAALSPTICVLQKKAATH